MAITWIEEPPARPVLRLVEGPESRGAPARTVRLRGKTRARLLVGAGVAAAIVGLSLPLSALGGRPAPGAIGTSPATGGSTDGAMSVYVVRTGDTLNGIASRFDSNDPRQLVRALERETGSTTVVPGERLVVP